jgi:nicotinate-nucleotide adenylyltransferase
VKRVGIFGGTLDPVHIGHLICAEQMREALDLEPVLLMPCNLPPHKPDYRPAPAEARLAMVEAAVGSDGPLRASDLEIERGGVSYTVDTVSQVRDRFGERVEIWLLMGMDSYLDVPGWKDPARIIAECFFGVACRPGYERRERGIAPEKTRFVTITEVDVSSTVVRRRLAEGLSVRYLVPDAVIAYIERHRPYFRGAG